jgi:transcriptional regulator of acetoin/glycerol metabolism
LESAVAVSTTDPQVITEQELIPLLRAAASVPDIVSPAGTDCSLENMEKFAIRQALRVAGKNKSRAALLLGISRASLYRKLRDYGIEAQPESDEADTSRPLQ